MTLFEKIHQVMAGVGAAQNVPVVDEHTEDRTWHIALDAETEIFAELDEARGVLVLSTCLGSAPVVTQALLEIALAYGHVWTSNGGKHMTFEGGDGAFWLLLETSGADLDAAKLEAMLMDLAAEAAEWRGFIGRQPEGSQVNVPGATGEETLIRI